MRSAHWLILLSGIASMMIAGLAIGAARAAPDPECRFGVTAPFSIVGLEDRFVELDACAFLSWGERRPSTLPGAVEFVHMIRTSAAPDLSHVSDLVADYPGAIWAIGNEADTCYFYNDIAQQDCTTPEVYAQRYYDIATRIRSDDSTATILFGNIVQPTELRLRYLQRAWEGLISLAGSENAAADLIDVWSIHSFILNEWVGEWGTGVPEGFDCEYSNGSSPLYGKCWDESPSPPASCTESTCWDMVHYTSPPFPQTHSNTIFNARIEDMRQWMLDHGERDKPLWITEYGSLFPPDDPDGEDLVNTTDADTADFMTGTFDFLRTATDSSTGYAADGNRLVQRWFWYSLNEHRYVYGGTLYDPDAGDARTPVGDAWVAYVGALRHLGDTVGLFNPHAGRFFLRNDLSEGDPDYTIRYGAKDQGWVPLTGDWDGDGIDTVGIFNPTVGRFFLRNSQISGPPDIVLRFGPLGWQPIVGDWDGDGTVTVGVYDTTRGLFILSDSNSTPGADYRFFFGPRDQGWQALSGDWDGDGDETVGIYNPATGQFRYRNSNTTGGMDGNVFFGPRDQGWLPIIGDWDDNDTDGVGVYNPVTARFRLRDALTNGTPDYAFNFGARDDGWMPLAGDWDGE
jgi:hypothetical protein